MPGIHDFGAGKGQTQKNILLACHLAQYRAVTVGDLKVGANSNTPLAAIWKESREMNADIARCGHVKRQLVQRKCLGGKVLEFAIVVIDESVSTSNDELLSGMKEKLRAGQPFDDYELHIMLDVLLRHRKLRSGVEPPNSTH